MNSLLHTFVVSMSCTDVTLWTNLSMMQRLYLLCHQWTDPVREEVLVLHRDDVGRPDIVAAVTNNPHPQYERITRVSVNCLRCGMIGVCGSADKLL